MKKFFFAWFLATGLSSGLLAQVTPSSSAANTTSTAPVQHLEATYKVISAKGAPRATVNWSADLQNDKAPFVYQVTVTLKNETDKLLRDWNLALLFTGCILSSQKEVMVNDPSNPGQQMKVVENVFNVSSQVQVRACLFGDGLVAGYAIFGGTLEEGTLHLPAQGSITFMYGYQLPADQTTLLPPGKMILSRALSYVTEPAPSEEEAVTTH